MQEGLVIDECELASIAPPLDVTASNTSLGRIDLGNVWLFSPTLMLQHHFRPASKDFRPYLGAGVNYAHFFNEDSGIVDSIDYDDSFGFALQAGFDYEISDHWAVNMEVKKLLLDTDAWSNDHKVFECLSQCLYTHWRSPLPYSPLQRYG